MPNNNNDTQDLVSLSAGKKTIGCKWVFAIKINPNESIARLKACLMAKGYARTDGVDYFDTFSPIAMLTSVKRIISMAKHQGRPIDQLDIKNVFLHIDLQSHLQSRSLYVTTTWVCCSKGE